MRRNMIAAAIAIAATVAGGAEVTDPQADYLADYKAGDIVKKMIFDINGDGVGDFFFAYTAANPDPTTAISDEQGGGSVSWDAYVSDRGSNTFRMCDTLEEQEGGALLRGVAPLDVSPDQMYVGKISEINRFGLVTSALKRATSENWTTIYAYTWEGDHFKQWKLAEYVAGEQNATFDEYLKDDKRTHV